MKTWKIGGSALIAVALLVGCTQNTAGVRIDGATQMVNFGGTHLDDRFKVGEITTRVKNGHTQGIVQLESQYTGTQAIQYRFTWYDNDGLDVNAQPEAWKTLMVQGLETVTLSSMSVNPQGTQFRIQIQEAEQ